MSQEEYRIAQMEIGQGISWSLSSIDPKTAVKKDDWDRLVQAYNDDIGGLS